MDENNSTQEVEVEVDDSVFDEGWDEESAEIGEAVETDLEPDAQPEPGEADEADVEDEAEPEQNEEEPEAEPEPEAEAGSQRYTLKFLGEDKDVSLDEMRELAEKGLNYDHVKEERDSLRDKTKNLDELEEAGGLLKELAETSGVTVSELIEATRARILVSKAEAEGKTLTEDEAREQVRANTKKQQTEAKPEETEQASKQEAVRRFVEMYPDVKAEDIPQSVWEEAGRVGDIIAPYQKYEAKKLRDEITQLKQNQKNRERSTGSRRTFGASAQKDAFDEGWDSDS